MIDEEMKKVEFSGKDSKKSKGSRWVQFVVTFHPYLICLTRITKDNLNILYIRLEAKPIFSPGPMVSCRSAFRIGSYLMRTRLYPLKNADVTFAPV